MKSMKRHQEDDSVVLVPPSATVWFDLSTSIGLVAKNPVGLSRLEMNVIRGALQMPADRVRFCATTIGSANFGEISREQVEKMLAEFGKHKAFEAEQAPSAPAKVSKPGRIREMFRTLERTVRRNLRRQQTIAFPTVSQRLVSPMSKGDYLVVGGALWHYVNIEQFESFIEDNAIQLVAVLADMIPWKFPHFYRKSPSSQDFIEYATLLARQAQMVLSISRSATADFLEMASTDIAVRARIKQVTLGGDIKFVEPKAPAGIASVLEPGKFILNVSTIQVRKNHYLLYQLWRRMQEEGRKEIPHLVLIGAKGRLCDDLVYQMQNDPLVKDRIILLNHATDAELSWLYQHCRFTVYPSLYEGWGLPIVESLHYGKACIASESSSMPEAGQGLALHLDPLDFAMWYRSICNWVDHPGLVQQAEAKIKQHYRHQSWNDFIEEVTSTFKILPAATDDYRKAA